jgi:predicted lipoprotein with Yx(FWY)xxD motif
MRQAGSGLPLALGVLAALALVVAGCGGNAATSRAEIHCGSNGAAICTKAIKVGGKTQTVLATPQGKTLYYYTPDKSNAIACTGGCAQTWPPLTASGSVPATLSGLPGKLSTFKGSNGTQVLYNGHPLYSYSKDEDAEDAYGQGIGGAWFVAVPDLAQAPSSGGYQH